jgi:antitoxin CcdA
MEDAMGVEIYDAGAAKKATNLTINSDLLRQARALGVNLSQLLEQRLIEVVRAERERLWIEENRAAIEAFNRYVERDGSIADDYRTF